jgi:hypothetical protein
MQLLMEASVNAATRFKLPSQDRILPSSLELERRTQPWCPDTRAVEVPFVAAYQKGAGRLVFVGVHYTVHPIDPTMWAVAAGVFRNTRQSADPGTLPPPS